MSNIPDHLKYTASHEWIRIEGDTAVIGITDHAQAELTDIVYVELPEVGRTLPLAKDAEWWSQSRPPVICTRRLPVKSPKLTARLKMLPSRSMRVRMTTGGSLN